MKPLSIALLLCLALAGCEERSSSLDYEITEEDTKMLMQAMNPIDLRGADWGMSIEEITKIENEQGSELKQEEEQENGTALVFLGEHFGAPAAIAWRFNEAGEANLLSVVFISSALNDDGIYMLMGIIEGSIKGLYREAVAGSTTDQYEWNVYTDHSTWVLHDFVKEPVDHSMLYAPYDISHVGEQRHASGTAH